MTGKKTDRNGKADIFILDFEMVLDTLLHEQLKSKLFGYGISGKTLRWIDSLHCYKNNMLL